MSFNSQVALTQLFQNNFVSVATLSAVGYDYALTFFDEIEYIWSKPWSWVSTLFVIVRYCGLYTVAYNSFGNIAYIISAWSFGLFVGAADFVMLLRVWAMYNRSRPILIALLILFILEAITIVLDAVINSNPKNLSATLTQILDFSFCEVEPNPKSTIWTELVTILQVISGAAACILAIVRCARELPQMFRMTTRWKLNPYMDLILKQGVLYFVAMLVSQIVNVLSAASIVPTEGWKMMLAYIVEYVPIYTLAPRFIISMRVLYARNIRCGEGLDGAFGLTSTRDETGGLTIMFADVGEDEFEFEETSRGVGTSQKN